MLSKKTKCDIKILVHLAKQEKKGLVQILFISKAENIPQKILESILLTLRKNGILGSKRGKGGGYYLLKQPKRLG